MTRFEDTFVLQEDPAPLVIVDYMVLSWKIHASYCEALKIFTPNSLSGYLRAVWAATVNRGPDCIPRSDRFRIVVVSDAKNPEWTATEADGTESAMYWRGHLGKQDPRIQEAWDQFWEAIKYTPNAEDRAKARYKGNRSQAVETFAAVAAAGKEYCKQYFPFYELPGYEADDWAGMYARLKRDAEVGTVAHQRQMLLTTVDNDWSALTSDEHKILFASTRYPGRNDRIQDRLRNEEVVTRWARLKLSEEINHPSEIAEWKARNGEFGDNLPPNAPVEYVDLLSFHPDYSIKKTSPEQFKAAKADLYNPEPLCYPAHYHASMAAIRSKGLPIQLCD